MSDDGRRQLEAYLQQFAQDSCRLDPDQDPVAVIETADRWLADELEGAGFDVTLCVHVHDYGGASDYTRYLDEEEADAKA